MKPHPGTRSSAAATITHASKQPVVTIAIKIILIALFLGCLANMPYTYYQLVRFTALIGFCYLALQTGTRNNNMSVFIYFALAILFQPIFKIALGRFVWNIVDVIVAIGLLASIFLGNKQNVQTTEEG
jgi:hypothetical protein